jgi:hypothetical protein
LAFITLADLLALKLPLASESGLLLPAVGDIFSDCVIVTCRQGILDKVRSNPQQQHTKKTIKVHIRHTKYYNIY